MNLDYNTFDEHQSGTESHHDHKGQDKEVFNSYYWGRSRDDFSPPPETLPTWDDIPVSNLPPVVKPYSTSGYQLRPCPRVDGKEIFSTWLDQDATATYHPDCQHDPYLRLPLEKVEGAKRKRLNRPDGDLDRSKVPKTITWQQGRFEGKRLPVTIAFTNEKGKAALAAFG